MLMPVASEAAKIEAAGQVLVAAEGVSMAFRGKPAVENVAIVVHASEIVTLIGPNGAGKTTLARARPGPGEPQACGSAMCRSAFPSIASFRFRYDTSCR